MRLGYVPSAIDVETPQLLFTRLLALALFLPLAALALMLTQENIASADVQIYAAELEHGEHLDGNDIGGLLTDKFLTSAFDSCRSNILRAALTIELRALDGQSPVRDYDAWLTAMEGGQALIERAEKCMPTDGNLWLRDAMVSRSIVEDPGPLAEKLVQSVRLAPAEEQTLLARWSFWNSVQPDTLKMGIGAFRHDLLTVLNYGNRSDLLTVLARLPPSSASDYQQFIRTLSPERMALVESTTQSLTSLLPSNSSARSRAAPLAPVARSLPTKVFPF